MQNGGWMPSAGIMQQGLGGFAQMGKRFRDSGPGVQGLQDNMMPALETQNSNMQTLQAGPYGGLQGMKPRQASPAASGFSGMMIQAPKFGGGL